MHDDDLPVGRVLGRREVVRLLALGGAAAAVGCAGSSATPGAAAAGDSAGAVLASAGGAAALPGCIVRPELEVGPFFLDQQMNRSDIRADPGTGAVPGGTPLELTFNLSRVDGGRCAPLAGAMVDIWHCDAEGRYSGVNDRTVDTQGQKFLRGFQLTDAKGQARITTIYPGWYQGRAVHIHFKVRTPAAQAQSAGASTWEFTSQLFFDDALTDRVFAAAPYAGKGPRDRRNADDGIYRAGGSKLMLAVAPNGSGQRASFDIGLDLSNAEVGKPDRSGRRGT